MESSSPRINDDGHGKQYFFLLEDPSLTLFALELFLHNSSSSHVGNHSLSGLLKVTLLLFLPYILSSPALTFTRMLPWEAGVKGFLVRGYLGDLEPRNTMSHHATIFTQEIHWEEAQNGSYLWPGQREQWAGRGAGFI